jgi:hydroxyethylthiazole kinase-like uncharacterized protein yjeF
MTPNAMRCAPVSGNECYNTVTYSRGAWTTQRVRAAEEALLARLPAGALMRRAAFGLATRTAAALAARTGGVTGRHVALLVGAGDNGGDALWAGALLRRRGVAVTAVLLSPERAHPEGLNALRRAGGRIGDHLPARAHLVLDGIVGLSGKGGLRPAAARLVEAVRVPIIAVDSPSGVDPDTGTADGPAVTATETVTFGARKPVHLLAPWRCGRVHLVDIGLFAELGEPDLRVLTAAEVGARWPVPGPASDKYNQGVLGIAAGHGSLRRCRCRSGPRALAGGGGLRLGVRRRPGSGLGRRAGIGHWRRRPPGGAPRAGSGGTGGG